MLFENLHKKLMSLESKIKKDLVDEIVMKGHKGSGELISSIVVKVVEQSGDYLMEIECHDYIRYLDHGKFLEDFLQKKMVELSKVISEEAQKDLLNILKGIK